MRVSYNVIRKASDSCIYKCQLAPEPDHSCICNDVVARAPTCAMENILYDIKPLLDDLAIGDVELRFQDGRSIMAHSQKLKLASKGILCGLLEDVLEGEIHAKRRRMDRRKGHPWLKALTCLECDSSHPIHAEQIQHPHSCGM